MKEEIRSINLARWIILITYIWNLTLIILPCFGIHWLTFTRTVAINNSIVTTSLSILGLGSHLFFMYAMWLLHREPHPAVRRMGKILLIISGIDFLEILICYLFPEWISFNGRLFFNILITYTQITAFGCILRAEIGQSGKSAIGLLCIAVFMSLLPTLMPAYQTPFLLGCISVGCNILGLYGWNRLLKIAFDLPYKTMTNYRIGWKLSYAEWGFITTTVITVICLYIAISSI